MSCFINLKAYLIQISAGYRSMEEQAALYGQSRFYSYKGKDYSNLAKPKVTDAKPGQSFHNFGLAVDYFLVTEDGKTALWTVNTIVETCSCHRKRTRI